MKVLLISFAVFVVGWESLWWIMGVRPISPRRLKRMLQEPPGNNPLLVDVRTTAEFSLFHIKGAESQPDLLRDSASLDPLNRGKPLVVVCLSGHRSPVAGFRLKKQGFKNVYYLSWGMLAWIICGGRVER